MTQRTTCACLAAAFVAVLPAAAAPSREAGWLAGYLRVDTTNPPGNEAAAAALLAGLLREQGMNNETADYPSSLLSDL